MKTFVKKVIGTFVALASVFAIILTAFPAAAVSTSSVAFDKSSLSQYTSKSKLSVTNQLLWSFDKKDSAGVYTVDSTDSTEGNNCGKASFSSTSTSQKRFMQVSGLNINASQRAKVTIKLDIWVNDMSLLICDHEDVYTDIDYSHSGTVYWRAYSSSEDYHVVATTINDNGGKGGWQTIEMSFLHYNGGKRLSESGIKNITSIRLYAKPRKGLVIKLDNLRACYYGNEGYKPSSEGIPSGSRVVSRCDADALDGALVSEWYGASFDFGHQKFGSSCIAYKACTEDDYRIFFGEYDFTISYSKDYVCFWLWLPKGAKISRWFMEANKTQDNENEFENPGWSAENITKHAVDGFKSGQWNLITLPLSALTNKNGGRDTIELEHFRMVIQSEGDPFTVYLDNVYFCNAAQAKVAADEFRAMNKVSSNVSSKPVNSNTSSGLPGSSDEGLTVSDASSEEDVSGELSSVTDKETSENATSATVSSDEQKEEKGFPVWGYFPIVAAVLACVVVPLVLRKKKNTDV